MRRPPKDSLRTRPSLTQLLGVAGYYSGMNVMSRLRTRVLLFVVLALLGVGVLTGLAFARSKTPVGTGVVVVTTKLIGGAAAGTGMVLTSSGEVLTNNHVIRGATSIRIVVPGTGRAYTAKVVGYDVADDVAVLQASGASQIGRAHV